MNRSINYTEMLSQFSDDELEYAEKLWPNPMDAPEVPGSMELRRFAQGEEDEHLGFQIENSINCLRAMIEIKKEQVPAIEGTGVISEEEFEQTMSLIIPSEQKSEFRTVRASPSDFELKPEIMEIWRTKDELPILSQDKSYHLKIKNPPHVLLLDDPAESEYKDGERIFRGLPVSIKNDYSPDLIGMDEIEIKLESGEIVLAHLFLNYPVSTDQLDSKFGQVSSSEYEKLGTGMIAEQNGINLMPADGAGLGVDEEWEQIFTLERERLIERCSFLSYFADYNFLLHGQSEEDLEDGKIIKVDFSCLDKFDMAASDKSASVFISAELKDRNLKIYFERYRAGNELRISVLHEGNLSPELDDTEVFMNDKKCSIIQDGKASFNFSDKKSDFSIVFKTPEGIEFLFTNKQE